ncbi:hypothetical protein D3C80_1643740 [compost metagenome]
MTRRHNPFRQLFTRLLVVSAHLILRAWHGQNMVRNRAQRLLAFTQTDTTLWHVVAQRDLVKAIAGFAHTAAAEQLNKVAWLRIVVSHR